MIPAGTKVRVTTHNGGDAVFVLEQDYHPHFDAHVRYHHDKAPDTVTHAGSFTIEGWRLTSIAPIVDATTDEIEALWAHYWQADRDMAVFASRTDVFGQALHTITRQRAFDAREALAQRGAWK